MANIAYIPRGPQAVEPEDGRPPQEPPLAPPEPAFDLRHLVGVLWRRKGTVFAVTFLGAALALLLTLQATPLYVAEAQLVVESQRERPVNFDEVLQGANFDFYTTQTEASVLMSRSLAGRLVDELKLTEHPALDPERAAKPGALKLDWRGLVAAAVPEWLKSELARGEEPQVPLTPEELARAKREAAIDEVQASIEVQANERSRVLRILYTSPDPAFSAQIANALAETYIADSVRRKFSAYGRATDWLNDQVGDLRTRLEASQAALAEHRKAIGYVNVEGQSDLLGQQLAQLSAELIKARSARGEAEARYGQVRKLIGSPEQLESSGAVLNSQLIGRLREQEAQVSRELADLSTQLGDRHPRLALKRNELNDLQGRIKTEVAKLGVNLGSELEIARTRERMLEREVAAIRAELERQNQNLVKLHALESEVRANNEVYQTILSRFKQTDVQEQALQQPDARLISAATAPRFPSYPKKALIVAVAALAFAGLGVLLVFALEYMDAGFRSLPQIEAATGAPGLGVAPKLTGMGMRNRPPAEVVLEKPHAAFSEAIRTVRTALMLSSPSRPPRTVLVSSSTPREGKTSFALSLARVAAKSGQRVIVVDCDLRRPSLHDALTAPNLKGLSEHLAGQAELEEVIEIDERSGAHFITAGHPAPQPGDLLASDRMAAALARLSAAYDLVVLDTAPVLAVSDALPLMRRVDKAVYLVRWGETRREAALAGLRMLADAGADLAGVVLTMVDVRKHSGYAYGAYRHHYGAYQKYYHS